MFHPEIIIVDREFCKLINIKPTRTAASRLAELENFSGICAPPCAKNGGAEPSILSPPKAVNDKLTPSF
jgi:hypothetical protein